MQCEMCGSKGQLYRAIVEDAELNICKKCTGFGKVLSVIKPETVKQNKRSEGIKKTLPDKGLMQVIVEDYSNKVKEAREKLGLKQEELANRINEKASVIHKIETGIFEPNVDLARKLERFLKIKLVEQHEETPGKGSASSSDAMTIGDIISLKKK